MCEYSILDLPPNYGWNNWRINCTITVPIEIGDRIRVFYKSEQTPEWTLVTGGEDCVWELLVADEFTIDETTSIRRNKSQKTIVVTTKDGVHVEWVHSDGSPTGDCYQTVDNVTTIRTEGLPAGDYLLKLKKAFVKSWITCTILRNIPRSVHRCPKVFCL